MFNLSEKGTVDTYFTMKDGLFFIANGESKKIMELNSYGNLLSLFYNPEYNPTPSFGSDPNIKATKKAVAHQFNTLGPVSVDSRKWIYAVDTLPSERQEFDVENHLLLKNVVLRFDTNGNFVDYIGQQGPGGAPFPFIKNIYTTKNNELVVVCVANDGPVVYWFNTNGFQMYKMAFNSDRIPGLKDRKEDDPEVFVSIENVIPDSVQKKVYVKVDYSESYFDPDVKIESGMSFIKTILYPISIENGVYEDGLEIPGYEETFNANLGTQVYENPFLLASVTDNGWFFFMVPVPEGILVQMVQPNGQKFIKRLLEFDHSKVLYHSIHITGKGIVTALFVERENAKVVWWRTDTLVNNFLE